MRAPGGRRRRLSTDASAGALKIATFNVNDVNRRLANLLAWLDQAGPDVVCLQELKAVPDRFPEQAIHEVGYFAV